MEFRRKYNGNEVRKPDKEQTRKHSIKQGIFFIFVRLRIDRFPMI